MSDAELSFHLTELTFSDDTRIELSNSDLVVIVGPNNCGKTSTLRDIRDLIRGSDNTKVVKSLDFDASGTIEDVSSWLKATCVVKDTDGGHQYSSWSRHPTNESFSTLGITDGDVANHWSAAKTKEHIGSLAGFFVSIANTENRLTVTNPVQPIDTSTGNVAHPLHIVYDSYELEDSISDIFEEAFGRQLMLNRSAGAVTKLHVDDFSDLGPRDKTPGRALMKRLHSSPELHKQGDGMRSFAGCVLMCLASPAFIGLLDEPESFLHPKQARLIGNYLARSKGGLRSPQRQLFVATHSGDVLRGIVEEAAENVKIIRLTRDGDVNHVQVIGRTDIKECWDKPALRYSNVLDGVFHSHVIVCENEADCRFYEELLRKLGMNLDLQWIGAGGKSTMPPIMRSLNQIGVSIRAIYDFDLLRDEGDLKKAVEAMGGDWAELRSEWQQFNREVNTKQPPPTVEQIRNEINGILDDSGSDLSRQEATRIRQSVKFLSEWDRLKDFGLTALKGGTLVKAEALIDKLNQLNIFPLPFGELEACYRQSTKHGLAWVNEVLEEKNIDQDKEFDDARRFISTVVGEP